MKQKEESKNGKKNEELAHDELTKEKFNTLDPNLVSLFPRITETPKTM
jgi:hypothetical protein